MSILSRLFKKSEAKPAEEAPDLTFKQRVESFWAWYASVADRFYQTIEDKQCGSLSAEVSAKVDEFLPGMAWVFGAGEEGKGHSFTLSGEGIATKQILAAYWLSRAPALKGWTFYCERQPSEDAEDFSLEMNGMVFKPIEFWVTPEIDEEEEHLDLTVWHPLADQAGERACFTALFLVLDEIFGEFGTGRWIGRIEFSKSKLGPSMPITELKSFLESAREERGWKMRAPGETWIGYRVPPEQQSDSKPRLDTISGTTACWDPLRTYFKGEEEEAPFDGFHADWVYLTFDTRTLPQESIVDAREDMSDVITAALEEAKSGRPLGGAIGRGKTYIDFLIYDGHRSIGIIREAAKRAGLPDHTRLEYLGYAGKKPGLRLFPG